MADTIIYISGIIILAGIVLALYKLIFAGNTPERIIAFDVMTISSLGLIGIITHITGRFIYIDVALIYGLLSFLSVLAASRYLEKGL